MSALDELVAKLRLERDLRLASVLHHKLHVASWPNRADLFADIQKVLRNMLQSNVSLHSDSTNVQIGKILDAIDRTGG